MNLLQAFNYKSREVNTFESPFNRECVSQVTFELHSTKSKVFREGKYGKVTISFDKNNASGRQVIYADTLEELVALSQAFIKTL